MVWFSTLGRGRCGGTDGRCRVGFVALSDLWRRTPVRFSPVDLELGGWDVVAVAVEAVLVEPVHPGEGGELELVDVVPDSWRLGAVDALGLVEAVGGLGQRVVVGIGDGPDARAGADLIEPLGEPHTRELTARIGVGDEADETPAATGAARHLEGVEDMSVRMFDATRQPTIIRENASTMKHT